MQTLFCNSIGCPNGFTPIDDAQNTECDADPCEVSQCCNLFCNSIGCPDGFIPIQDAQNTLCDADPCEESQCCEAFCSFHPCSDGLIPIEDAGTTLCPDSGCTDELCCEGGESRFNRWSPDYISCVFFVACSTTCASFDACICLLDFSMGAPRGDFGLI